METRRLPKLDGDKDKGKWGEILNSYLRVSLGQEGGLNSWTTLTRPSGGDYFVTGINTTLKVIERWNGIKWETILGSELITSNLPINGPLIISANNSPASWKSISQYVCDGNADEVEINNALNSIKGLGGEIKLAPGSFNLSNSITFDGLSNQNTPSISLIGSGIDTSILFVAPNKNGISLTAAAKVNLADFSISISGSGSGIFSTKASILTLGAIDPGLRGFYLSSFKNIKVFCDDNTHTGWAFNLGSPFRSTFCNMEGFNMGNGMIMKSEDDLFNPGDCTWDRSFIELNNRGGTAYAITSNSKDGYMNQNEFRMIEGICPTGQGSTFLKLDASTTNQSGSTNNVFLGMNAEEFTTILVVQKGSSNVFEFNYIVGAPNSTYFKFGVGAYMNFIRRVGILYVNDGNTITLLNDLSNWNTGNNRLEHVNLSIGTGAIVKSIFTTTKIKNIGGYNSGNIDNAALLPGVGW
jgi:hypothetical protein